MKTSLIAIGAALVAAPALASPNLIVNGDFSAGNVGFTSQYAYQSDLVPEGTYFIDNQQVVHNTNWQQNFAPYAGEPEMMIVNGASTAGVNVWSETITGLVPNTLYYFSSAVASVYPTSPAVLNFSVDGSQIGADFTASSTVGQWNVFFATFFSGTSSTADISIVNQNTAANGNDFALDQLVFSQDIPGGTSVPEPSTLAVLALGLAGLAGWRRSARG